MLVKHLHARDMEEYMAENVVARVFIGRQDDPRPQIRTTPTWPKPSEGRFFGQVQSF